jgi:hypothetical protein
MSVDSTGTSGQPSTNAGQPTSADVTAGATNPPAATDPTASTQATEPKATEPKAAEPQVPETYELKMPEGMTADKDAVDAFTAIAKDHKLTNEQAQKFTDIAVAMRQRDVEAHAKQVADWLEQTKTDKEFGGDKLEENLGISRKAMDTFGSPELKQLLDSSGLGNHPAVVRAFFKAGKAISEDRFVTGAQGGGSGATAQSMYSASNMNP